LAVTIWATAANSRGACYDAGVVFEALGMTDVTDAVTQGNHGGSLASSGDRLRALVGLAPRGPKKASYLFYRHTLAVRALHWLNAIIMLVMLMSGLQIFNAHPALYWGNGADFDHPFVALTALGTQENFHGVTQIGSWSFNTDGVLGASWHDGVKEVRGFPDWVTMPSDSPASGACSSNVITSWQPRVLA